MKQKYIITTLASIETLTLFPLLFWGIYYMINSTTISQINTMNMFTAIAVAVAYSGSVLFGSFKAIQNIAEPQKAYAFLLIPVIIASVTY
jgi:hypothetical protein